MTPTRIGYVRYLNTLPLVRGLEAWRDADLTAAVPSRLIDLLVGGEIDVGLVSIIDAARSPVPLAMLPVGMIGSDGPTLTVRLFSTRPFDRVAVLHADTDSHTSVALARLVLAERFGARPEVVPFDARERMPLGGRDAAGGEGWPETVLLIGDKVVTDPPRGYAHVLDLGEAWRAMTGLPFVYAAWMCRREDAGSERVRTACAVLERARRRNRARLAWIAERAAGPRRWPAPEARRYLGRRLRFEVGEREREAVARRGGPA